VPLQADEQVIVVVDGVSNDFDRLNIEEVVD
jgi:hypothetical protein